MNHLLLGIDTTHTYYSENITLAYFIAETPNFRMDLKFILLFCVVGFAFISTAKGAGSENKFSNAVFDADGDGWVSADDLETCAVANHDKFETNWPSGGPSGERERDRILQILNNMVEANGGPIQVNSADLQSRYGQGR